MILFDSKHHNCSISPHSIWNHTIAKHNRANWITFISIYLKPPQQRSNLINRLGTETRASHFRKSTQSNLLENAQYVNAIPLKIASSDTPRTHTTRIESTKGSVLSHTHTVHPRLRHALSLSLSLSPSLCLPDFMQFNAFDRSTSCHLLANKTTG